MIPDWNVPFTLTTPAGSLALSGATEFKFDQSQCDAGADLRVVRNDVPAEDGSILGRILAEGYKMRLAMWVVNEAGDACLGGTELQAACDLLGIHMWALRDPDSGGRIQWLPEGQDARMLDQIKILERAKVTFNEAGIPIISFMVGTRYPYAMDVFETVTSISSGSGASLVNTGTAEFWPVFKVYGATDGFTLTNGLTGLSIVYDGSFPGAFGIGGGDYVEIDTFRNTAYLNGDGANVMPGIDMENSDFWSLFPGSNSVTISGASVDVLWQAAWE